MAAKIHFTTIWVQDYFGTSQYEQSIARVSVDRARVSEAIGI